VGGIEVSIIILIHQKTHCKSVVTFNNFFGDTPKDLLLFTTLLFWFSGSAGVFAYGGLVAVE
jgi:hypothetical protein